jgi:polyisoprenoid-binding protein YceI
LSEDHTAGPGATDHGPTVVPDPLPTPQGRVRRTLHAPAARWLTASFALIAVVGGVYLYSQIKPLLTSVRNDDVSYTVPSAPRLVAAPGETVYRIDPTQSKVTYSVAENIVGQTAGHATGSTSGVAGDMAVNSADPAASRMGQIVVDVEELHSDNNLRDARIRQDFLASHDNPLVTFTTDSLTATPASIAEGQTYSFTMTGQMTVSGKASPVTWDVQAKVENGQLAATATTQVKMSALGIGPISLAGLVKTGDDVALTFDLVALDPSKATVPDQIASPISAAASGSGPSFKKDVAPILSTNCASCHNSGQVGAEHWTLDTASDAAKVADGIGAVTKARYMPPWPASDVGVPLDHSKTLSQHDIDTIVAWSQSGGQIDVPETTPIPSTPPADTVRVRHDITLAMPDAYAGSTTVPNDYRCFVLDPKITDPTYLTGYEVTPGQRQQIHHAQLFHIDATQAVEGLALSGGDGKPGWSCYAGPSLPTGGAGTSLEPSDLAASTRSRSGGFSGQPGLIAGWVPGQDPSVYPEGSGILMQPGDAIVLQVHYHYSETPVPDQTTVALQTDPGSAHLRPIDIVNPVGPVEIPCMPGDTAMLCDRNAALADDNRLYGVFGSLVEPALLALCQQSAEQMAANFAGIASSSCDTKVPEDGVIVAAMGHMHTLGKNFRLTLKPGASDEQVLLDIPTWNFDWQMNYQIQAPVHVTKGETLRMSCSWDRSLDPNRPSKYIVFAEGTEDEMCFSTYAIIPDS